MVIAALHQIWVKHLKYFKYVFHIKFLVLGGSHLELFEMASTHEIQYDR